eukprot:1450504-Alexandrium_andersonii.AAC.1
MVPRTPSWELPPADSPRSPPPVEAEPTDDELVVADLALEGACAAHLGGRCTAAYCRKKHLNED